MNKKKGGKRMSDAPDSKAYVELLERWIEGAEPYLYVNSERPDLSCYGTGDNGWGVQTNQKAFAAYAMLAVSPHLHLTKVGKVREEIRETALRLFRYSLQSHHVGAYHCMDGTSWGNTWISALGVERMMHGVDALSEYLTDEDNTLLRKVLLSESDWLLDHYTIEGGLYAQDGHNKPESNLWNGALLHRTATRYPEHSRAQQYKEKGNQFFINSISIPSDASNENIVDGKPVSERFVGANFFESFALNHHGYLNIGYMVICLSNVAMLHFMYRARGIVPPESLYHHVKELWQIVKSCIFPDGRMLRIGGDTRARYTYCQEYLVPVWLMARDLYGDESCASMEWGWLAQVRGEMDVNGDGTFLSRRGNALAIQSPLYFTRLESDRATALSMGVAWADLAEQRASLTDSGGQPAAESEITEVQQEWHDEYHGAYLHRSDKRIASWVWDSAEKPQGLCIPPDASHMAEWRENLAGKIKGLGKVNGQRLVQHRGKSFEGGFITWGSTICYTEGLVAEGKNEEDLAVNQLVCAALPDDTHMVILQYTKALDRRIFVNSIKGLQLLIPNDVYNANHRHYYYAQGVHHIHGHGSKREIISLDSAWLNVDNRIGVVSLYGPEGLAIDRPGRRQIGLKQSLNFEEGEGTLYADEICGPVFIGLQSLDANQVILDTGYLVQAGREHTYTEQYAVDGSVQAMTGLGEYLRGVQVRGADGYSYCLLVNFGKQAEKVDLLVANSVWELAEKQFLIPDSAGQLQITLESGEARLLRL
jgi:hypothetical protein